MPTYSYRAFGLTIEADAPVPGLVAAAPIAPDLRIHFGTLPPEANLSTAPERELWRSRSDGNDLDDDVALYASADGQFLTLRYADGTRFVLRRSGREIWTAWSAQSSADEAATYLLGPVVGFALRLRGVTCLHASTVVSGGCAVALAGPTGMGKSTIAAAYALRGGRVIADDVSVLSLDGGHWMVQPSIPGVRLWDDSVAMLLGRPDALPLLSAGWDKRMFDLLASTAGFRPDAPVPLGAVYLLDATEPRAPRRLGSREALLALVANSYANVLLDADARRIEFEHVTTIARAIPVWRVRAPTDAQSLDRFCGRLAAAGDASDFDPGDRA
ncbi:MAG TPA: hypothetical protein VFT41_07910 [Gemmatimonadaceae bacterium]|nr:hypothetical protein [Gemmatimonadaceae bacterium]